MNIFSGLIQTQREELDTGPLTEIPFCFLFFDRTSLVEQMITDFHFPKHIKPTLKTTIPSSHCQGQWGRTDLRQGVIYKNSVEVQLHSPEVFRVPFIYNTFLIRIQSFKKSWLFWPWLNNITQTCPRSTSVILPILYSNFSRE